MGPISRVWDSSKGVSAPGTASSLPPRRFFGAGTGTRPTWSATSAASDGRREPETVRTPSGWIARHPKRTRSPNRRRGEKPHGRQQVAARGGGCPRRRESSRELSGASGWAATELSEAGHTHEDGSPGEASPVRSAIRTPARAEAHRREANRRPTPARRGRRKVHEGRSSTIRSIGHGVAVSESPEDQPARVKVEGAAAKTHELQPRRTWRKA